MPGRRETTPEQFDWSTLLLRNFLHFEYILKFLEIDSHTPACSRLSPIPSIPRPSDNTVIADGTSDASISPQPVTFTAAGTITAALSRPCHGGCPQFFYTAPASPRSPPCLPVAIRGTVAERRTPPLQLHASPPRRAPSSAVSAGYSSGRHACPAHHDAQADAACGGSHVLQDQTTVDHGTCHAVPAGRFSSRRLASGWCVFGRSPVAGGQGTCRFRLSTGAPHVPRSRSTFGIARCFVGNCRSSQRTTLADLLGRSCADGR